MFFKYLFIFALFSFVGWLMEFTYRSIVHKAVVNPGFMTGCVVPLYGFGALILTLLCDVLPRPDCVGNVLIIFFVSMLALTLLELFSGYTNKKFYNLTLWDYSKEKFNFKGYICLRFSIIWGLLALLFSYFIYPSLDSLVSGFLSNSQSLFYIGLFYGVFLVDLAASVDLSRKVHQYAVNISQTVNLEKLRLDLKLQQNRRKFVNSFYPYITTNQYLREKINEIKENKKN